jgi:hypothetical protein
MRLFPTPKPKSAAEPGCWRAVITHTASSSPRWTSPSLQPRRDGTSSNAASRNDKGGKRILKSVYCVPCVKRLALLVVHLWSNKDDHWTQGSMLGRGRAGQLRPPFNLAVGGAHSSRLPADPDPKSTGPRRLFCFESPHSLRRVGWLGRLVKWGIGNAPALGAASF